jgi:hypothetical protein
MVVKPNKWQSPPSLAKTWYLEVDPIPAVRSGIDKLMERFGYVNVYFRFESMVADPHPVPVGLLTVHS